MTELASDETVSGIVVEGEPEKVYERLVKAGREVMSQTGWMLGDLAIQVERIFAESVLKNYAHDIGVSPQTVYNARTIARAFPEATRPEALSFSAAKALAAQPDRQQVAERRPEITVAEAKELARARGDQEQAAVERTGDPEAPGEQALKQARKLVRQATQDVPVECAEECAELLDAAANRLRRKVKKAMVER